MEAQVPTHDRHDDLAAPGGSRPDEPVVLDRHRTPTVDHIAAVADEAGLRRIHMLAWRDLYDPEAGGSELHAATVAKLWSQAGVEVTMRSSYAQGHPPVGRRDGYTVVRRAGRYAVFPRAAWTQALRKLGPYDGLVEIWNGMPFLSPMWCRGPRMVWLHHLHGVMWSMALPDNPRLAQLGKLVEYRLAPPLYRRTPVVTVSPSSRQELVDEVGFRPELVSAVPPGVHERYTPGGTRSTTPLVLAVGRLVPVKRYDRLLRALAPVAARNPGFELMIVGEGYERPALEELVDSLEARSWARFLGRVDDERLVDLYRRAWTVVSASAREGWGMTLTEAAACGTPSVATRIAGHVDAVDHEETGLLVDGPEGLTDGVEAVVADEAVRRRLTKGALAHAGGFTWTATALRTLEVLAADARRRRR